MKKTFLILFILFAGHSCFGQQTRFLEVAILPTLGFNVSQSTFRKGYKKEYHFIEKNISGKDFYYGVGLQVNYMEDWFLTLRYGNSAIGAGYKIKDQQNLNSNYQTNNIDYTASPVNILDATLEKNVVRLGFFNHWAYPSKLHISLSGGIRYISIVKVNRTDSLYPLPVFQLNQNIKEEGYEKQFRDGGVALSAGIHFQLFIKNHRSLKIGALYSYLLRPIFEYQFHVTGTTYENGLAYTYRDDFNLFPGRHQVLFYVSYPIKLFRINY